MVLRRLGPRLGAGGYDDGRVVGAAVSPGDGADAGSAVTVGGLHPQSDRRLSRATTRSQRDVDGQRSEITWWPGLRDDLRGDRCGGRSRRLGEPPCGRGGLRHQRWSRPWCAHPSGQGCDLWRRGSHRHRLRRGPSSRRHRARAHHACDEYRSSGDTKNSVASHRPPPSARHTCGFDAMGSALVPQDCGEGPCGVRAVGE